MSGYLLTAALIGAAFAWLAVFGTSVSEGIALSDRATDSGRADFADSVDLYFQPGFDQPCALDNNPTRGNQ